MLETRNVFGHTPKERLNNIREVIARIKEKHKLTNATIDSLEELKRTKGLTPQQEKILQANLKELELLEGKIARHAKDIHATTKKPTRPPKSPLELQRGKVRNAKRKFYG
jgi:hypothetical protein